MISKPEEDAPNAPEKGKLVERTSDSLEPEKSFLSRVGQSASNIYESTTKIQNPETMTDSLAALQNPNGKGGSTLRTGQQGQSESKFHGLLAADSAGPPSAREDQESFRSSSQNANSVQDEVESFLSGSSLKENIHPGQIGLESETNVDIGHHDADADGAEVVKLLSKQGPLFEDDALDIVTVDDGDQDHENVLSSPNYAGRLESTTKSLQDGNLLDLVPKREPAKLRDPALQELKARGMDDIPVGPWLEILGKYHDEVWGDMLPAVIAAREELREARDKTPDDPRLRLDHTGPALQRLRMLLQHIEVSK